MVRVMVGKKTRIEVRVQLVARQGGRYLYKHSKSLSVYGDATVQEVFDVVHKALEEWASQKE